jgi:flagellar biosynthesis GTPase FlhF
MYNIGIVMQRKLADEERMARSLERQTKKQDSVSSSKTKNESGRKDEREQHAAPQRQQQQQRPQQQQQHHHQQQLQMQYQQLQKQQQQLEREIQQLRISQQGEIQASNNSTFTIMNSDVTNDTIEKKHPTYYLEKQHPATWTQPEVLLYLRSQGLSDARIINSFTIQEVDGPTFLKLSSDTLRLEMPELSLRNRLRIMQALETLCDKWGTPFVADSASVFRPRDGGGMGSSGGNYAAGGGGMGGVVGFDAPYYIAGLNEKEGTLFGMAPPEYDG